MHVLVERNVHEVLPALIEEIRFEGEWIETRNGRALTFPGPVTICYEKPMERCVLYPERGWPAASFLMEAIWMMAGRNDLATVEPYLPRLKQYSDDGVTLAGAYGHRWRRAFGADQLGPLVQMLRDDKTTRRAVLQMWSPELDLFGPKNSKDKCCNLSIAFRVRGEEDLLDMTVFCRSNDVIYGTTGANAVHFGVLHEYVAAASGYQPGRYYQISNDMHIYEALWERYGHIDRDHNNPYDESWSTSVKPVALVEFPEHFLRDCEAFAAGIPPVSEHPEGHHYFNRSFEGLLIPLRDTVRTLRDKTKPPLMRLEGAYKIMDTLTGAYSGSDWAEATEVWIESRFVSSKQGPD